MKKKVNFLFALATAGLMWTGCSNESDELVPNPNPETGEKSGISLVISNGDKTRAASGTEGATPAEKTIDPADGLKVYVFNNNGTLDFADELTLTDAGGGKFKTEEFDVVAGKGKYFFVFANDEHDMITEPSTSTTMNEFMAQNVTVALDAAGTPDIADTKFLMGSLWKEAEDVALSATPRTIPLKVGRLSSKVILSAVSFGSKDASLLGEFSTARFRLGTIPKKINTVGIFDGTDLPTAKKGVIVKSAVHNAAGWTLVSNVPTANNYYTPFNTDWAGSKTPAAGAAFYTTENTTGLDTDGLQYYGNTTFIQMETVYIPGANEVYNTDLTVDATYTPGAAITFYTARVKSTSDVTSAAGKWIIFKEKPVTGTAHGDIELGEVREYVGGKNYHKFAIYDKLEDTDVVAKNRVLRNHHYQFSISKFNSLGSYTDIVDPTEPIPNTTTVDVEVEVLDWDKVTEDGVQV